MRRIILGLAILVVMCVRQGNAGTVAAWGYDGEGEVSNAPTGTGFTAIAGGVSDGYALRADGSIAAWGNDLYGAVSGGADGDGIYRHCGREFYRLRP